MKYTIPLDVESDLILEYFEKEPIKKFFTRAISEPDMNERITSYIREISDYLIGENKRRKPEEIIREVESEFLFNIKLNMFIAANSSIMQGKAFYDYERRLAKQMYLLSKDAKYLEAIINLCGEAILRAYMMHYNPGVFEELQDQIAKNVNENNDAKKQG